MSTDAVQYMCDVCDWEYDESTGDPDGGVAPGTKWADVPDDWVCPDCGAGKSDFSKI
jgi:rubredoxin